VGQAGGHFAQRGQAVAALQFAIFLAEFFLQRSSSWDSCSFSVTSE
jgi:hypothetical protein